MNTLALLPNLAGPDMLIIFLIVLIMFGAKKLPELAKGLGQAIREFSKAKEGIQHEFDHAAHGVQTTQIPAQSQYAPAPLQAPVAPVAPVAQPAPAPVAAAPAPAAAPEVHVSAPGVVPVAVAPVAAAAVPAPAPASNTVPVILPPSPGQQNHA